MSDIALAVYRVECYPGEAFLKLETVLSYGRIPPQYTGDDFVVKRIKSSERDTVPERIDID